MNKHRFKYPLLFSCLLIFTHCEKDDICLSTVSETPDMIVLLLDKDTGLRKTPTGFRIRPVGSEKTLTASGDSLTLPLQTTKSITQFEFIRNAGTENENIDTLQINYKRIDQFINGACGYRANFILDQTPTLILNSGNDWIKGSIILKDTISDETAAHLGILH